MNKPRSQLRSGKIFSSSLGTGRARKHSRDSLSSIIRSIVDELSIQSSSSEHIKTDVVFMFSWTQSSFTDDDLSPWISFASFVPLMVLPW
jgi:hypothetical protein